MRRLKRKARAMPVLGSEFPETGKIRSRKGKGFEQPVANFG
jgi:hypothetical protein